MQRVIKYEDANKITDLCPLNYCPLEVSVDELNSEFRQDEVIFLLSFFFSSPFSLQPQSKKMFPLYLTFLLFFF